MILLTVKIALTLNAFQLILMSIFRHLHLSAADAAPLIDSSTRLSEMAGDLPRDVFEQALADTMNRKGPIIAAWHPVEGMASAREAIGGIVQQ